MTASKKQEQEVATQNTSTFFNMDEFKKRLAEEQNGKTSKSQQSSWLKIQANQSVTIRIIPNVHEEGYWPFIQCYQHWEKNKKYNTFYSRKTINANEYDPFIELASNIYHDTTIAEEDRKNMFKRLMPNQSWMAYVIERGKESEGLKIWGFSSTLYKQLRIFLDKYDNLISIDDGIDIDIVKNKSESGKASFVISLARTNSEIWNKDIPISKEDFYDMIFNKQKNIKDSITILPEDTIQNIFNEYTSTTTHAAINTSTKASVEISEESSSDDAEDLINQLKNKLSK